MKGYYQKRGKTWTLTLDIGKDAYGKRRQRRKGGFKTKKEAEKACAELIMEIENVGYKELQYRNMNLNEFIMEYMENHVRLTIRPTTYHTQMNIVSKHIIPELGHHLLKKITPLMIQKFYSQKIEEGYSAGFIKNIHAILCKTLKTASEWEYVSKNIAPLVKPPRIPKRKVEVWSIETANSFLTLVEQRRFFIVYVLGIYTGMRKGEILGLRWKDCNLEEGKISIQQTLAKVGGKLTFQEPKTSGSERTITLPNYATTCLKRHKIAQAQIKLKLGSAYQDHDLVICSTIGKPIDTSDINRDMTYVIKKHNLPKISFHGLRHTHATMLLSIGENAKVVSERLGHANIGITLNTYSHVLPNMQKSLAENFDLAMKKSSTETI